MRYFRTSSISPLFSALFLLVCSTSFPAFAQRLDGTLRVSVSDNSGAIVPDATVTATNEATNVASQATSSDSGVYVFPNLTPGAYQVAVEKQGFQKYLREHVQVGPNQITDALAKLQVGELSTQIEVTGEAPLKITASDITNTTVTLDLPVAQTGGDVKELAVYLPNTTTQPGGVAGGGGAVGGLRPRFNSFTIDGADDNSPIVNGPLTPVIGDAVSDFTVLTNQFSAEYGHSAGGIFAVTTKSGTNTFHGEGHWYNRNKNYNALDNLEKERGAQDRYDYNREGASLGGPIVKNRLFFFGAYEHQGEGKASSGPTVNTPTAAGLATLRTMAANSTIRSMLDQFAAAPAPTSTVTVNGAAIPVGLFQGLAPNFVDEHDFNTNIDFAAGRHQLRGRFLYDRQRQPHVNPVEPLPQFNGTKEVDARKAIFSDIWTLAPTVVNEFRTSYSRAVGPNLIVPGAFSNFPNIEVDELGTNVGPEDNSPQTQVINIYQWLDNVTKVAGNHTFKGGVEIRNTIAPGDFLPRARGEWDYATLQEFINDQVPSGANGALRGAGNGFFAANFKSYYTFFQDTWKMFSRFTLNYGIRYEWNGVPRDENVQALNAIASDPSLGIIFRRPKSDKNNWAPRLGFSYDPTGSGRWVVRGGIGYFYDVTPVNFPQLELPPQLQTEQNPDITCSLATPPAWCATGAGFLAGGGLLQVNVPPTTAADARANTQGLMVDVTEPKVLSWNLSLQREVVHDMTIELRYLGTHAVSLPVQIRRNAGSAFDPAPLGAGLTPLPTFFSPAQVPAFIPAPVTTLASFNAWNPAILASHGFLGNFTEFDPVGQSIYHAGAVDVVRRIWHGLSLQGNFTFAKTIDNATNEVFTSRVNPRRPQNFYNMADERGRSALDINKKFAVGYAYEIPTPGVDNKFARGFLGGWEISGTYLAESGQPITALSGVDSNVNGDSAGDRTIRNPNGVGLTGTVVNAICNDGAGGRTRIVASAKSCATPANAVGYVAADPTATFVQAGVGSRPTEGRNTINTPGLNIWNMSFVKNTNITENSKLQFRVSTFNTFNHPNKSIGLPTNNGTIDQDENPNPLSTAYPFVTAGNLFLNNSQFNGGKRTIELGLKYIF